MSHITEIVPELDKMPGWAREAFESGQFFHAAFTLVAELEGKLEAAEIENHKKHLKILKTESDLKDAHHDIGQLQEATIKEISELVDNWAEVKDDPFEKLKALLPKK